MSQKRENFVRLAEARVSRAVKDLSLIGNLSNQNAYEYDDEDVRKIFRTLQEAISTAKSRFKKPTNAGRGEFRL